MGADAISFSRIAPRPSDRLAIMRLEVAAPSSLWYAGFSRQHPDLVLEVTSVTSLADDDTLGEYEIYGPPEDWTREIRESANVREVECIGGTPELGRYRVRYHQSALVALANELEVLVRYPRTIRDGILSCEVIARRSQLRRLVDEAAKLGYAPRLTSLNQGSLRSVRLRLTSAQRAVFRHALALGYFEVPRRISLTRLAEKLSRSKSTISETLAVVERKLAETAFGG